MEQVLASWTSLRWQLLVGTNDRITDGALSLALQSARNISAPGTQSVYDATVLRKSANAALSMDNLPKR